MSLINQLTSALSQPVIGEKGLKALTLISNKTPDNQLPIWIPEAFVLTGRTGTEYQRSGFLGAQERLFEELVAATIWLQGVQWLGALYDKLAKKYKWHKPGVDGKIDFPNIFKSKSKSLKLSQYERYSVNRAHAMENLMARGKRLFFSVGLTTLLVGVVVPIINQLKTSWLHKRIVAKRKKKLAENPPLPGRLTHQIYPSDSAIVTQSSRQGQLRQQATNSLRSGPASTFIPTGMLPPKTNPAWTAPAATYNPTYYNASYNASMPMFGREEQHNQQKQMPGAIKFGGIGGHSWVETLGHLVDNTDFGKVLAIDVPLTSGRAVSYGYRSPYEGIEVIYRDIMAVYFYMLAFPHTRALIHKLISKPLKTSAAMDSAVANQLHNEINQALGKKAANAKTYPIKELQKILYGEGVGNSVPEILSNEIGAVENLMRRTGKRNFMSLLQMETRSYLGSDKLTKTILKVVENYFKDHHVFLTASDLQTFLDDLSAGKVKLPDGLSKNAKQDVETALKKAFYNTAGQDKHKMGNFFHEKARRSVGEFWHYNQRLQERVATMAQRDGLKLENTMFREIINRAKQSSLGHTHELVQAAEKASYLLENAASRNLTTAQVIQTEASEILDGLTKFKKTSVVDIFERLKGGKAISKAQHESLTALCDELKGHRRFFGLIKHSGSTKLAERISQLQAAIKPGVAVEKTVQRRLDDIIGGIEKAMGSKVNYKPLRELVTYYKKEIANLRKNGGRIVSVITNAADKGAEDLLKQKAEELLYGGLTRDSRFLQEALHITGNQANNGRQYASPYKLKEMRHTVKHYAEVMMKSLGEAQSKKRPFAKAMTEFMHKCRNTTGLTVVASYLVAGAGLGLLVPAVQFAITRLITGKNEHPGIAALKGNETELIDPNYIPIHRNSFNTFKSIS